MPAPTPPTAPTLRCALDRARAAWLAGHPGAWDVYRECLRQVEAVTRAAHRPPMCRRARRRPRRP